MARYNCQRCGVVCFTTEDPHLCKDIARRLRRREAQVQVVLAILDTEHVHVTRAMAEAIVAKLSQMGVTDD